MSHLRPTVPDDFGGARAVVLGLGRFGGGLGATRWLLERGAHVTVSDRADAAALQAPLAALAGAIDAGRVTLELGGHRAETAAAADLVVVNPAIPRPWTHPAVRAAEAAGVTLTTEIELLVQRLDRTRVIGITGTAGKSTTATFTAHLLRRAGLDVRLGGNLGGSLLGSLPDIGPHTVTVLELSSFQLFWLGDERPGATPGQGWSPAVAGWTNLAPNHLDWHGSMAHYERSKSVLVRFAPDDAVCVRGDDAPPLPDGLDLRAPGAHNRTNGALAVALAQAALDRPAIRAAARAKTVDPTWLADAAPLPDRLEPVEGPAGHRFVNDSKCTTPEGVALAAAALSPADHLHVIVGGYDKGSDLRPITDLAAHVAGLYTIGTVGPSLAEAAAHAVPHATTAPHAAADRIHDCGTLETAVHRAWQAIRGADVPSTLLLSPGCASWDQFDDYRARGDAFRALVRGLDVAAPPR